MANTPIVSELVDEFLISDSFSQKKFCRLLSMYNENEYQYYFDLITNSNRAKTLVPTFRPGPCFMIDGVNFTPEWDDSFVYKTKDLIDWAKSKKLKLPSELRSTVNSELSKNERLKLLSMLLGMAVSCFGYSPYAKRNTATGDKGKSIKSAVQQIGLDIDEDTVRKYLQEAFEAFESQLIIEYKSNQYLTDSVRT